MYRVAIKELEILNGDQQIAVIAVVPPDGISLKMLKDKDIDWVDLTRALKKVLELIDDNQPKG